MLNARQFCFCWFISTAYSTVATEPDNYFKPKSTQKTLHIIQELYEICDTVPKLCYESKF